ncbi:MAG: hypothetical protein ACRC6M_18610 [Microcystaceae cyanobacterium]
MTPVRADSLTVNVLDLGITFLERGQSIPWPIFSTDSEHYSNQLP